MTLSQTLADKNITLPPVAGPFGAYVPVKKVGNLIYVAGQLPMRDGKLTAAGQVPIHCGIDDARDAARQCVINALGAVKAVLGSVDVIAGVVRVGVFVNSHETFAEQPKVANGASELLVDLLGDAGKHVRAAVGVNTLPLNAAVEVEFVFEAK
jgi:enamine deaminase RidA (YjgF/YER057c/UK114 family)